MVRWQKENCKTINFEENQNYHPDLTQIIGTASDFLLQSTWDENPKRLHKIIFKNSFGN